MTGKQTIRGRTVDVDASFSKVVNSVVDNGGTLVALMLDGETRNGPYGVFFDVIWDRVTLSPSGFRTRDLAPGVTGTLGASLKAVSNTATVELGGAYEVAQFGPVALDVIAGARYWYQQAEIDLALSATLDVADLTIRGDKAIAKSSSVDWLDGFAGARARVELAPGQYLQVRGDVGGGGSKFSWQALAAYSYDFTTKNNVTYSGVIGYKALYVDYEQGEGITKYRYDMLQHGPVVGLNIRF
jgi:hypothetical protein